MKNFSIPLSDTTNANPESLLKCLQPVCALLSLYNGPDLTKGTIKNESGTTRYNSIQNNYAFTLTINSSKSEIIFGYFLHGEPLIRINLKFLGQAVVEISESVSTMIEMEIRKSLLQFVESELDIKTESTVTVAEQKTKVVPKEVEMNVQASTTSVGSSKFQIIERHGKWMISFVHESRYVSQELFLRGMNFICQEFSFEGAPIFSRADVKEAAKTEIPETKYYFDKSKDKWSVSFLDHTWDSGSHSYPNGYEFMFNLIFEPEGTMIQVRHEYGQLIFETNFDDKNRFASSVRKQFEGVL